MTIPSRPAPAPPQPQRTTNNHLPSNRGVQSLSIKLPPPIKNRSDITNYGTNNSSSNSITRHFPPAKTRYAPTTNWSGTSFDQTQHGTLSTGITDSYRKCPPPRPPPPKFSTVPLKKPGAPLQSVNVLSNLFGRKKGKQQLPQQSLSKSQNFNYGANSISKQSQSHHNNPSFPAYSQSSILDTVNRSQPVETECQLISFDSPPSSPTLTQKSNSDCLSVDSFSSDSNFSSPNNGSVSQPESGFEDDFSASRTTTSPFDPWEALDTLSTDMSVYGNITNDIKTTAPVRNLDVINSRIQNSNDNQLCNGKSLLPPLTALSMPTIIKPKISQKPKAPRPPVLAKNFKTTNIDYYGHAMNSEDPPMPSCPPPALPANINLLDVVTGNLDAASLESPNVSNESPFGIALYDFEGIEDTDLSFKANEKIYIIQQINDEWTMGRNRRGCEGMFPSNYIDIKVNLPSTSSNCDLKEPKKHKIKSLYTFVAEQSEDLSLNENDLVTIICRINEDWLFGEVNGRQGQFPANFLEYIPDDIPMA